MVPDSAYIFIFAIPTITCVFSIYLYRIVGKWMDKQ